LQAPQVLTGTIWSVTVTRYRCEACGNLTRFDVTVLRRTTSFHHFNLAGDLDIEDAEVLSEVVEDVRCRWCGTGGRVVELDPGSSDAEAVTPPS
jgi:hypothetical protein